MACNFRSIELMPASYMHREELAKVLTLQFQKEHTAAAMRRDTSVAFSILGCFSVRYRLNDASISEDA